MEKCLQFVKLLYLSDEPTAVGEFYNKYLIFANKNVFALTSCFMQKYCLTIILKVFVKNV